MQNKARKKTSPKYPKVKFENPEVSTQFNAYPKPVRDKLLYLRNLIFFTASRLENVGKIEETLKWGQPSYLTSETKSGTTIRIDQIKSDPEKYALYVHCQTNLIETFKEIYPETFHYEGNRSIIFDINDEIPHDALEHCISMALTYHLNKKGKK